MTLTERIFRGAGPRMLIWVAGEASGVPGSGEIVSRGVLCAVWLLASAHTGAVSRPDDRRGHDRERHDNFESATSPPALITLS